MKAVAWTLVATLLCVSAALGEEVEQRVGGVAAITNEQEQSRLLFAWTPEIEVENVAIWKARLRFELTGGPEERTLPIAIHPITTPWNPGSVSWESGWQRPGGDFDEELFARAELDLGAAGPVSIDVTSIVKEMVEDGYTCHGFLVTVDRSIGIGISSEDVTRFGNLGDAVVDISYRTTPQAPRAVIEQQEG